MESQVRRVNRIERLIERVPFTGCWLWLAAVDRDGYGLAKVAGRMVRAHRRVYELIHGAIPAGLQLDHGCRVRCCVNPAHLEPVTARMNTMRGFGPAAINAAKTHCSEGHLFTKENTYLLHGGTERSCRTCNLAGQRRRYALRKGRL